MPRDSRSQAVRRHITCHRHPAEFVTGFCASCLRDRLAFLDSSSTTVDDNDQENAANHSDPSSSLTGELRRCKSYSSRKCAAISGVSDQRRKSCDVAARDTLSHLFNRDDVLKDSSEGNKVESKNLGFAELTDDKPRKSRVSRRECRLIISDDDDEKLMEQDLKTMKEHIEIECQSRRQSARDFKDIAESFWTAASVFSRKLRKWSQKQHQQQKKKKPIDSYTNNAGEYKNFPPSEKIAVRGLKETRSEIGDYGLGRRSCDADPRRFSVDAGRISFDDPRFSFDEHRASWDGYMIARTIPRLAPMLSVIEDVMLAPMSRFDNNRGTNEVQPIRESIIEDDTACCSDSSSSQMRNSFDCSSSSKSSHMKTAIGEVDEISKFLHADKSSTTTTTTAVNSQMKAKVSHKGDANDVNKFGRWRKWKNNLGFKQTADDLEGGVESNVDGYPKLTRSGSCVSGRQIVKKGGEDCVLERSSQLVSKQSSLNSSIDNGLLRFHLTPQWGCRRSKSGKRRPMNSPSPSPMAPKNTHSMI